MQARIDGEWADRVVPWVAAGGLFVVLAALALTHVGQLTGGQVGAYAQAAWLVAHGQDPFVTVRGAHLLADHAPLGFYPIALVAGFLPAVPALLVLQSAALALAVVPLWQLCRRVVHLRAGASTVLLAAYAAHPAVHNMNLAGFHPETLAVPALVWAAASALGRRWLSFAAAAGAAVLLHAELGLVVAGLGAVVALDGHRRAGLVAAAFGLAWTAVAVLAIGPSVAEGELVASAFTGEWLLRDLTAEQNLSLVVGLLGPVLFLPVLAPRYLLPAVPLQAVYLLSDTPAARGIGDHHVAAATAIVFAAAAVGLGRAGRKGVVVVTVDRSVLAVLAVAAVFGFLQGSASSPYREPWEWGRDVPVERARRDAAAVVPEQAGVSASVGVLPPLADRGAVFTFPAPWYGEAPGDPVPAAERRAEVTWVVVDTSAREDWGTATEDAFASLDERGFEEVWAESGVLVFRKDRP